MKLSFHGAAQNVTGSCHLVEVGGRRILVDCGLFQGSRELDEDNAVPFGFDARAIDFVLLTHAHLDHCGRLPLLVKRGFRGEIIATQATSELARLVMLDAANLQEEEARPAGSHGGNGPRRAHPPLYTRDRRHGLHRPVWPRRVLWATLSMFARGFGRPSTMRATFLVLRAFWSKGKEQSGTRSVLFSGDIGGAEPSSVAAAASARHLPMPW